MRSIAAGSLDRYREAARGWFLAKADAELGDAELSDLPRAKKELARDLLEPLSERLADVVGSAPTSIALLADRGTFHAVFRIVTACGTLYARTSVPSVPWPALDFAVEAWAARTLPSLDVPVPRVRHLDLSREVLAVDVEILDEAPGEPLSAGPEPSAAVHSLGAALARLHSVGCRGAGPIDPGAVDSSTPEGLHAGWSDYLLLKLDQHLALCASGEILTGDEISAIGTVFERSASRLDSAPAVLLHGDLGNHNILVGAERVTALLDWEDALAGDPVFDIAGWGTFVGNHERRSALLDGYRSVPGSSGLPDDFELRYWLYYLRIMLAKTVHRHRFGYSRTDRIPAGERLRPALEALSELVEGVG